MTELMEKRIARIIELLEKEYPKASGSLRFANPLELLVSTILSAQCTDARVNMVTQQLFKKYKTAQDYAKADVRAFEQDIFCGAADFAVMALATAFLPGANASDPCLLATSHSNSPASGSVATVLWLHERIWPGGSSTVPQ